MHHVYLEIMKKIWKTVNARFLVYRNNGKIGRVSAGDGWKMWIFCSGFQKTKITAPVLRKQERLFSGSMSIVGAGFLRIPLHS